jgi:hypothetical protein
MEMDYKNEQIKLYAKNIFYAIISFVLVSRALIFNSHLAVKAISRQMISTDTCAST